MKKRKQVKAIFWFAINVSQFLSDALAFYKALLNPPGSSHVSFASGVISAAQTRATNAQNAESNVTSHTVGLTKTRDVALGLVTTDVDNFVMVVQTAVNNAADVATANQIVADCLLHTKKYTPPSKDAFKIENDELLPGQIDVSFKAAANRARASYELQESTDGINYATVKCSPDAHFKYPHLKSLGTKLWHRGRINLSEKKGGAQPWLYPGTAVLFTK